MAIDPENEPIVRLLLIRLYKALRGINVPRDEARRTVEEAWAKRYDPSDDDD